MFDPSSLPRRRGQLLLVTDRLAAPGEFIILSILASHLKQAPRRRCILVSFSQVLSHWISIAARLSPPTNVAACAAEGSFTFLDGLSGDAASVTSLRPLFDQINELLQERGSVEVDDEYPNMIILDGLSLLEWSGTPTTEIKRFVRALLALCRNSNSMLLVRLHRVTSENLDDLQRALLSLCALHLEVFPLGSGRSSAISGEIALHAGPLLDDPKSIATIHRSAAMQYQLRDSGATYFGRGTSSVVL